MNRVFPVDYEVILADLIVVDVIVLVVWIIGLIVVQDVNFIVRGVGDCFV